MRRINDVRCRRCKAPAKEPCTTPSGNPAREPHMARVNAFWAEEGRRRAAAAETARMSARKVYAKKELVDLARRIGGVFDPNRRGAEYAVLPAGVTPERVDYVLGEARRYDIDVRAIADANKERS